MVTNVTVNPIDNCAVIYLQDGSTAVVDPGATQSFQLIDMGFCTVSEAKTAEEGEHPPSQSGEAFVIAMIEFWEEMADKIEKAREPEVNPL